MKHSIFFLLLLISISSCKKEETIPSRIFIPEVFLSTQAGEGSESHKITDLYVYIDGDFMGVFPLPAYIPVLKEGQKDYRIIPGIKVNGILEDPRTFPFYTEAKGNITLTSGETTELSLTFEYKDNVIFSINEDFENDNIFSYVYTGNSTSGITNSNIDVLEGQHSGLVELDTSNVVMQIANETIITGLPTNGSPAYLELSYKNTAEFHVGVIGYVNGEPTVEYKINLYPKDDWNKIYIELTPELEASKLTNYRIIFLMGLPLDSSNQPKVDNAEVNIDNIKLLHF